MQLKILSKPTNCDRVRSHFSEYLDGVLFEEERHQVHEHVRFCVACSDELDSLCKTLSLLVDFREEELPSPILNFRLPRSSFVEIFPTIKQEAPPMTLSMFAPYLSALILFFVVISTWISFERRSFEREYNASNYVEVVAKG